MVSAKDPAARCGTLRREPNRVRRSGEDQLLRAVLDEDPLVVADAVLNGVNNAVGHRPPCLLVEGDRSEVVDPRVQLEVRVAAGGDHRLGRRKQVSAEAPALVAWLDEQVDELVAADREVADRRTIDTATRVSNSDSGRNQSSSCCLVPAGSGASSSPESNFEEYVFVKQPW